jgi:hypothetical protein
MEFKVGTVALFGLCACQRDACEGGHTGSEPRTSFGVKKVRRDGGSGYHAVPYFFHQPLRVRATRQQLQQNDPEAVHIRGRIEDAVNEVLWVSVRSTAHATRS